MSADDANLKSFESLFASGKPRCGQARDSQREFLFAADAPDIGSVALVPLGEHGSLGLLALGSTERDRFHPGMSTEFLARLADLIADAVTPAMTPAALGWIAASAATLPWSAGSPLTPDSNYARDLAALVRYCDQQGIADWAALDSHQVRHVRGALACGGSCAAQHPAAPVGGAQLLNFLIREARPEAAIARLRGAGAEGPAAPAGYPGRRSDGAAARDLPPGDALVARDRAIMELLYSSGLRLAELVGLDLTDLDLEDRTVRVLGKGSKTRIMPVGSKALRRSSAG